MRSLCRLLSALAVLVTAGPSVVLGDCVDVIRASRLTTTISRDTREIEEAARNFCKEYDLLKGGSSAASGGIAYGILAASFATGSASLEQVRDRYCDASDYRNARSDAFRSYVDLIAPGAYSAYEKCIALENIGVGFSIAPSSVLPTSLTAAVSYTSPIFTQQTLTFAASPDVSCSWLGKTESRIKLTNGTGSLLTCTRRKSDVASYVQLIATTSPNATLSFPWSRFKDDIPQDQVASLRHELAISTEALASLRDGLKSAVVAFALNTCPPGWREYVPAQGRFIRGLDKGAGIDPEPNRLAGSTQEDAIGRHRHSRPRDVYDAGGFDQGGGVAQGQYFGYGHTKTPETGDSGEVETRPKNVALLFCTPN